MLNNWISFIRENNLVDGEPKLWTGTQTFYDVGVERDREFYIIDLVGGDDSHRAVSTAVSTAFPTKQGIFTSNDINRMPHDLVRSLFSMHLELTLGEVKPLHRSDDVLTPDVVVNGCVLEISTSVRGAQTAREMKTRSKKYISGCRDRGLAYGILGVSSNTVASDYEFPDQAIVDILMAYNIGLSIQKACVSLGLVRNVDVQADLFETYNPLFVEASEEFGKFPTSKMTISNKDWLRWSQHKKIDYSIYKDCWKKSMLLASKQVDDGDNTYEVTKRDFDAYVKTVNDNPMSTRTRVKKLPVPLCMVLPGLFDIDKFNDYAPSFGHPLIRLWKNLLKNYEDPEKLSFFKATTMTYTLEDEKVLRETKKANQENQIWKEIGRYKMSIEDKNLEFFQDRGLLNKKRHSYEENKGSSQGFRLFDGVDFSDYEAWLNGWESMMSDSGHRSTVKEKLAGLIDDSGMPLRSKEFVQAFYDTKLGSALEFYSNLFSEINVNLRKPVKTGEMYVARIRNFKAMLAMHNTGSSKHCFYTIIVKKEDYETLEWMSPFRPWFDVGEYMISDICSTRRDDVSMQLSMYSKAMSIIASTQDVFSEQISINRNRCEKEALFAILVAMENGNQTSDVLMQPRFNYMQSNVTRAVTANYACNASKYPTLIYSRLALFAITKIITEFTHMALLRSDSIEMNPPDVEDDEGAIARDCVSNLTSYISGAPLKNYEEALLLSYMGIYHIKDKSEAKQSAKQIFNKTIKMEILARDADPDKMMNGYEVPIDPDKIKAHEFSGTHLRNCGLTVLEHLENKGIGEGEMMEEITKNINEIYFEELATLKASSQMKAHENSNTHGDYTDKFFVMEDKTQKDDQGRVKTSRNVGNKYKATIGVLEVMKLIDTDSTTVYQQLPKLIKCLYAHGGIVAILFKKNQLSGVREIFILTMVARMVIRFVESISRTIATHLTGEYLTKGSEKTISTPDHYRTVISRRSEDMSIMTLSDSLDCATWCQNFVMPAFGNVLAVTLRSWPELSNVVREVLNSVTHKRHELPYDLMNEFISKPNEKSTSPALCELKEQFAHGGGDLINEWSVYLKNITNMMQGILHYTTTVAHAAHLHTLMKIVRAHLRKTFSEIHDVIITPKCSSDDASYIITVIFKDTLSPAAQRHLRMVLIGCSNFIKSSYPLMCAKVSDPKSTVKVFSNIEEFNSYWTLVNTVLSIATKFAFSAIMGSVYRSPVEKQRTDHNAINDYIANGGTMESAKVLEYSCAMQYYEALGYNTVNDYFWDSLKDYIIRLDHHTCMKYIMSPPIVGTLLGLDYTLFCHSKKSVEFQRTETVVRSRIAGGLDDKLGLAVSVRMIVGSDRKYNEFKAQLETFSDEKSVMSRLNRRPLTLYMESTTATDSRDKIHLKSIVTGISRSFAHTSYSLMQQTSCYICTWPCITVSTKGDDDEWVRMKRSLPSYLEMMILEKTKHGRYGTPQPHNEFFKSVYECTLAYNQRDLIPTGRRRKLSRKVSMPKSRSSINIDLLTLMKYHWWGMPNGYTKRDNDSLLEEYIEKLPWLHVEYKTTVENVIKMGFEENPHLAIYVVLTKFADTNKTVAFLTNASQSSTMLTTLMKCIERCQRRDHRLRPVYVSRNTESVQTKLMHLESDLFPQVVLPTQVLGITPQERIKDILTIFDRSEDLHYSKEEVEVLKFISPRYKKLLCMVGLINSKSQSEAIQMILDLGPGFLISFIKAQTYNPKKKRWSGRGIVRCDSKAGVFYLHINDECLERIQFQYPQNFRSSTQLLTRVLKRLNVRDVMPALVPELGMYIDKARNVRVTTTDNRGVPIESLSARKTQLMIKVWPRIRECRCLCLDVYARETALREDSDEIMGLPDLSKDWPRWIQSEPISFYPEQTVVDATQIKVDPAILTGLMLEEDSLLADTRVFLKRSLAQRMGVLGMSSQAKYAMVLSQMDGIKDDTMSDVDENELNEFIGVAEDKEFRDWDKVLDIIPMKEEAIDDYELIGEGDLVKDVKDLIAKLDPGDFFLSETGTHKPNDSYMYYGNMTIWDPWITALKGSVGVPIARLATGDYSDQHITDQVTHDILQKLRWWRLIEAPNEMPNRNAMAVASVTHLIRMTQDEESEANDSGPD